MRLTAQRLLRDYGADVALRLMREWGGHSLPQLPATFYVKHERDQRVRALVDAGLSYREAAARVTADGFPCSKSQAERIASRP